MKILRHSIPIRFLEETAPDSKTISDLQSRTLITIFLVLFLVIMYCILWLLLRNCGRSVNCPNNCRNSGDRSSVYKSVLDRLPVMTYTLTSTSSTPRFEPGICAICLGEYEEDDAIRFMPRCNHYLHKECLDEWLLRSFKCPICRAFVTELRIDSQESIENDEVRRIRAADVNVCPPYTSVAVRSLI